MKFKTALVALALTGLGSAIGLSTVVAADSPVEIREGLMKKAGGAMGALAGIAKGDKPYDAEVVKTSLTTLSAVGKDFPNHFPEGSEAGSEASPAIWKNMDDFKAKAAKLSSDADALLAQLPADQAGVKAAVGTLGANCGSCHEVYRLKK
ncbi:c-type cytochrome [Rhizobium sp. SG2393]|uniref:c-type cytochrome n=1 Tax=Rhizobium sp. SG2393 TaxID=3276279 RepID=UPI00366BE0B6